MKIRFEFPASDEVIPHGDKVSRLFLMLRRATLDLAFCYRWTLPLHMVVVRVDLWYYRKFLEK